MYQVAEPCEQTHQHDPTLVVSESENLNLLMIWQSLTPAVPAIRSLMRVKRARNR